MIIDASALVAIVTEEPDGRALATAIGGAATRSLSAANYLEAGIVIDARGDAFASGRLDDFIARASIKIAPVTESQARIARKAYRDFGRGSGHPARLNFGDCFAYALAMETGEPLLYKGTDFGKTDVTSA